MDVTRTLATFAGEASAGLPEAALRQSYRLLLDTLGVAIGAVELPPARSLLAEIQSWGGTPEAAILASDHRTSAVQAAYANAYLANVLDADETLLNHAHIATAIVAGALAVAERIGASGRDLLDAIAVGYEVAARIGLSYRTWQMTDGQPDWSPVTGYSWVVFGVTAAAGRLISLDAERMASAFGIAGYSAPIPSIGRWVDCTRLPHTKYVFLGPLAHAGVASAFLAARDFTGDRDVLDGDRGFWRMVGSASCDWAAMTAHLGSRWLLDEVSYKRYPACRFYHGALDLFARFLADDRPEPDEIDRIVVQLPPAATRPYFLNPHPHDVVAGSFSVPHAFACLAFGVPIGPAWHSVETRNRLDVARFRERVTVTVRPEAAATIAGQLAAGEGTNYYRRCPNGIRVEVGGRTWEAQTDVARGDPWSDETFLPDAMLEEKFLTYTGSVRGAEWAKAALASIRELPAMSDVRGLRVFEKSVDTKSVDTPRTRGDVAVAIER